MRFVSAGLALSLSAIVLSSMTAAALPATSAVEPAVPSARHDLVRYGHGNNRIRFFNRTPTSPYRSFGHPRLYYYPWGLRPDKRRWF